MILEVAADAGIGGGDGDAHRLQVVGRADAREQEELRRVEGAAAQDHLAVGAELKPFPAAPRLDADGGAILDQDAVDEGAGQDLQILRAAAGGRRPPCSSAASPWW